MSQPSFFASEIRLVLLFVLLLTVLSGCSDKDDSPVSIETDANASTATQTTSSDVSTASANYDCDALGRHAAVLRGANGWLPQVKDAESFSLIGGDLDQLDAAIEGLRQIQDIEGVFGTSREGLDNLAADVQAIRDGRFDEKVGDYGVSGIGAVLGQKVCK